MIILAIYTINIAHPGRLLDDQYRPVLSQETSSRQRLITTAPLLETTPWVPPPELDMSYKPMYQPPVPVSRLHYAV